MILNESQVILKRVYFWEPAVSQKFNLPCIWPWCKSAQPFGYCILQQLTTATQGSQTRQGSSQASRDVFQQHDIRLHKIRKRSPMGPIHAKTSHLPRKFQLCSRWPFTNGVKTTCKIWPTVLILSLSMSLKSTPGTQQTVTQIALLWNFMLLWRREFS